MPDGVTVAQVMDDMPDMTIRIICTDANIASGLIPLCEFGGYGHVLQAIIEAGGAVSITTRKIG